MDLKKIKKGEIKDLRGADLSSADLRGADLSGACLRLADLGGADLSNADLRDSDLRGAYLMRADLSGADLSCARLPHYKICPTYGSFYGWKKLKYDRICKLKIPAFARRTSSLVGRKCRAEFAIVEEIERDGKKIETACSEFDERCIYRVGQFVRPDAYDPDIRVECSNGVHFFMTYEEAMDW